MKFSTIFLSFLLFIPLPVQGEVKQADLIIFSFDRPLQLYALLESIEKYVIGLSSIQIIFRSSTDKFAKAYEHVQEQFLYAEFVPQGKNPRQDFKPLTVHCFENSPSDYVLFGVDDIIIKDFIDISDCISALETTNAYGFYLRLGKNITYCYPLNLHHQVPPLKQVSDYIYSWVFKEGRCDWNYPHTVDMTIYRKRDLEHDFKAMSYSSPNRLEAIWAGRGTKIFNKKGVCYEKSKIVNLPLNRVQDDCNNCYMNCFTSQELLNKFESGFKIDIKSLFCINNIAPHMEYIPTFIVR